MRARSRSIQRSALGSRSARPATSWRPSSTTSRATDAFWDAVLDSATQLADEPTVITGDFNTGRHLIDEDGRTFHSADRFEAILDAGWVDGFRSLHGDIKAPSWWSPGYNNGFRLDHALISAGAPTPTACRYETTDASGNTICGPAKGRLSDHAAMIIDVPNLNRP
ncbi:MAG: hypothetical protein R2710_22540 [Acidimicrobiales bacterium]